MRNAKQSSRTYYINRTAQYVDRLIKIDQQIEELMKERQEIVETLHTSSRKAYRINSEMTHEKHGGK